MSTLDGGVCTMLGSISGVVELCWSRVAIVVWGSLVLLFFSPENESCIRFYVRRDCSFIFECIQN